VQGLQVPSAQHSAIEVDEAQPDQRCDVVPDALLDRGRVGQRVVEIEEDAADGGRR
jgi:hypothetical protein